MKFLLFVVRSFVVVERYMNIATPQILHVFVLNLILLHL